VRERVSNFCFDEQQKKIFCFFFLLFIFCFFLFLFFLEDNQAVTVLIEASCRLSRRAVVVLVEDVGLGVQVVQSAIDADDLHILLLALRRGRQRNLSSLHCRGGSLLCSLLGGLGRLHLWGVRLAAGLLLAR